jgi:hypothetical protein
MIFNEAREALALAVPPHPGDPLAGLPLPNADALDEIRQGQNIGHQYYMVASELVEIAERRLMGNPARRVLAALKGGRRRAENRPAALDTHNLGDGAIDALVRLEEAIWSAHGARLDFDSAQPNWRDEAILALFYGSPWRLRQAWDLGPVVSDPVTGEIFVWPLERILALEWRARALAAREMYHDLPLTARACDMLKARAQALLDQDRENYKALYMLLWADFAESLYWSHYDLVHHPTWEQYAEGRLAQRNLRLRSSKAAVEGLVKLLFGPGYAPQGLTYLRPWRSTWDHVGALISRQPLARKSWSSEETYALPDAA